MVLDNHGPELYIPRMTSLPLEAHGLVLYKSIPSQEYLLAMSEHTLPLPVTASHPHSTRSSIASDPTLVHSHHDASPPTQPAARRTDLKRATMGELFTAAGTLFLLIWVLCARIIVYMGFHVLADMLYVLTGHAILRATHSGYSVPLVSSMKAGAVGGAVFGVPILLLELLIRRLISGGADERKNAAGGSQGTKSNTLSSIDRLGRATAEGAIVAVVGVCILRNAGVDGMLDNLHAARAGALGGVVLNAALIAAVWVVTLCCCPVAALFFWQWQ
ncbi:hypothetical protein JAAARDRAFT_607162 [Jaapia argillacea MUCL 33604]|uniref:Uncharacterized protein n=1 Tax=Jaapia argillacea MUCL 33604 TaxID=933084 RepID=A0A067Q081_9AGAM|nr:hypothetical protein JAAARDRAFT_607162 [Jaapia argillacea MUCL 33604]